MMRVRFPFFVHKERTPEWVVGGVTMCWGAGAFIDSFLTVERHMMDSPFFAPLTFWAPQTFWGVFAFLLGATRITFLVINGSRPRGSTTLRSVGAGLSAIFWSGMFTGALSLSWSSGAVWTYGGYVIFDLLSLYRAAREAPIAFANARAADGSR